MGASETKFTAKNIRKSLAFEKELEDPRFGTIQIFLNTSNNEHITSKEKVCRSSEELKELKYKIIFSFF